MSDLLEQSSSSDLGVILSAKEKAKREALENPSKSNLSALDAATKMLEREQQKIQEKKDASVATKQEALAYLTAQGRKIGQSKLYKDVGLGVLRSQPDGSFRKKDLDVYAASLAPIGGVILKDKDRATRAALRKAEASAKREEEHYKTLARKREILEGKYLPRSEVLALFAGRAAMFEQNLKAMMRSDVGLMVQLVEGNPDKELELYNHFEASLHALLAEYCKADGFEIEFSKEALAELENLSNVSEEETDLGDD